MGEDYQGHFLAVAGDRGAHGVRMILLSAGKVIDDLSGISSIAADIFTVAAIIAGLIWFFRNRQQAAKARVEQRASHWQLSPDRILLRVEVRITNIGNVLLRPDSGIIRLQRIRPCQDHILRWLEDNQKKQGPYRNEAEWEVIAERRFYEDKTEIEPSESDSKHFDFLLPSDTRTFIIYTHIVNSQKQGVGWNITDEYDLGLPNEVNDHGRQTVSTQAPTTTPSIPQSGP